MSAFHRDLAVASVSAWLILSAVLLIAALAPFVLPAEWLFRVSPVCEAKKRGGECLLCGMTTAYAAIGRADLNSAIAANAGSLALWGASVLNFPLSFAYLPVAVRRWRRTGDNACN